MSYLALKHLHVTCVVLSGVGFCLRGLWMLSGSPLLGHRLTRVLPHLVDTLLLGSALSMVWLGGYHLFAAGWLTAKLGALLVYIVLGSIALKRGRTPAIRGLAMLLALLAYAYIVGVALTRNPLLLG